MFRKSLGKATMIAATLALTVVARPAARADEDTLVPFEVRLEGFADPTFNADGSIDNKETAVGLASHLGVIVWESEEHAVFLDETTLAVKGRFTLTGANGDQVFGTYKTIGNVVNFPMGHFEGTYKIRGGTGRFANATGRGAIVGDGNLLPPFEIVGSLSGTISPPGH